MSARWAGSTLSWRLAGMETAVESGVLPFIVQWEGPAEHHPGAAETEHDADPEGIAWIEVTTGDEERLRDWLGETSTTRLCGSARVSRG